MCVPVNLTIQLGAVQAISSLSLYMIYQDWQRKEELCEERINTDTYFSWVGGPECYGHLPHRPKEDVSVLTSLEGGSSVFH